MNPELLNEIVYVENELHQVWRDIARIKKQLRKKHKSPIENKVHEAIHLGIQIGSDTSRYLRDEIPLAEMLYRIEHHITIYHNRLE